MAHNEAETQSPAINPASAASNRRKRLILLSSEDLRPVVCALEDALRNRGWEVDVELGSAAKPWIQQVPPVRPSLRVLCVPSVDPNLARQLRATYRPDSDADLHIVGVDRTNGLVQEIERLAGVENPRPRPLSASPRLSHPTVVETQMQSERRWLVGATSAMAAFALTLGGIAMVKHSPRVPELLVSSAASLTPSTAPVTSPSMEVTPEPETSRFDDPVFAAVTPLAATSWEYEHEDEYEDDGDLVILPDEDEDDDDGDLLILPDEPAPMSFTELDAFAPSLDEPEPIAGELLPTNPTEVMLVPSGLTSMAGVLPPTRQLPRGFLPVAGMTPPPSIMVDPFAEPTEASAPLQTVDPFAGTEPTP